MKTLSALGAAGLLLGLGTVNLSLAGPITAIEAKRQAQVLEQLKKSLGAEETDAGKFTHLTRVMKVEPNVEVRRRLLEMANQIPGPDLEQFLTGALTGDADAGVRSQAATTLGRVGSEKCLPALARAAATDRTTEMRIGDVGGQSSARRAATFAIAELAVRFPNLADKAAAELRALKPAEGQKDGLADARTQALYQITKADELLKPFHDRLQSQDARERERGVVALRFLKLKSAPAELVAALKDDSRGVRSWTALVLGEIGDPKTVPVLMAVAGDPKEDRGVRANAVGSLGRMKAKPAADLMRKLLEDDNANLQGNAAIALYHITGEKVKQLPKGYNAD
jgi:HEAT repeat protein